MKMNEFKNENARGMSKARASVRNLMFTVSSVTSGICLAAAVVAFAAPGSTFESAPITWTIGIIIGFAIATGIDFLVNIKLGKFAMSEVIAIHSGHFSFGLLRKVSAYITFVVVLACFAISGLTSWDGSSLAAGMTPTFTPPSLQNVASKERSAVNESIKPYKDELLKVEAQVSASITARTSGELSRLSKQGNAWAKAEINKIQGEVTKQYSKDLNRAKDALSKAEEREHTRADKIINDAETTAKAMNNNNKTRSTIIGSLLALIGTVPVIVGFLLLFAECSDCVARQIPRTQIQQTKDSGQRNSAHWAQNDAMYENP